MDGREESGIKAVELRSPFLARVNEPGRFEHGEVLRHRLPRGVDAVVLDEARRELKERLVVSSLELVEQHAPGVIGERLEERVIWCFRGRHAN